MINGSLEQAKASQQEFGKKDYKEYLLGELVHAETHYSDAELGDLNTVMGEFTLDQLRAVAKAYVDGSDYPLPALITRVSDGLSLRNQAEADKRSNTREDDNTYTIVENYAIDHPLVGMAELAVYTVLCNFCHMPKRTCNPSTPRLAKILNCHRETVVKAIDVLVEAKLVHRSDPKKGCSFTYTLLHRHRSKPTKKGWK